PQRCESRSTAAGEACGMHAEVPAPSGKTIHRAPSDAPVIISRSACKCRQKAMSKTAPSRAGNPQGRLPQSGPVAQLAPVTPTAPVPPQNLEAEESVLGAMMISPGAIGAVSEILDAGDFYRESHAKIYRAAFALYAKGEPVDAITLVDELEERSELEDVGGRVRVHELAA